MIVEFVLGNKLPRVHEMVEAITMFTPGKTAAWNETKKRTARIVSYTNSLIELWSNAFGQQKTEPQAVELKLHKPP